MSTYARERVEYCSEVVPVVPPPPPPGAPWKAGPPPGPIMVVSTESSPGSGVFIPRYAEVGSASIAGSGEGGPAGIPGTWVLIIGRWPIKQTPKLVAGTWSTTVLLQYETVAGYERHRAYVLDSGTAAMVRVTLRGTEVFRDVPLAPGENKYVETMMAAGSETLSAVQPVTVGTPEMAVVTAVNAYAELKGLTNVTH